MKRFFLLAAISVLTVNILVKSVFAGPPFNNLEGVGGVAFNPLAYLADSEGEDSHLKLGQTYIIGKPRFGAWYVNLDKVSVDWTAIGIADTLFKRLELSYGNETIAQSDNPVRHKNNYGAKLLLLPENAFETNFLPALSVGTIFKTTNKPAAGNRKSGFDYYFVATKTVTQLPRPVILSAGVLSSGEYVTGVYGFTDKRKQTAFANIDVVLPYNLVLGYEFKQGEKLAKFKNANYWDVHLGWLANKNLTLIAAYTDAGSTKGAATGLGNGFVLSAQYAF
ncbi:MAG: DUF3034 family protein [Candidatus Omnitrophica bacterium]|nr:DUF3034 family protein [Candidatus Omnitrophota bacterium]